MSWRTALDEALDAEPTGPTLVKGPRGSAAEVEVAAAGPIGVRVGRVRLTRTHGRAPSIEAERLTRELRALPRPLTPVEVDDGLGGAILRSQPDQSRTRDFHEVEVRGQHETEVRRWRVDADGMREPMDSDLTRETLADLLDELDGPAHEG